MQRRNLRETNFGKSCTIALTATGCCVQMQEFDPLSKLCQNVWYMPAVLVPVLFLWQFLHNFRWINSLKQAQNGCLMMLFYNPEFNLTDVLHLDSLQEPANRHIQRRCPIAQEYFEARRSQFRGISSRFACLSRQRQHAWSQGKEFWGTRTGIWKGQTSHIQRREQRVDWAVLAELAFGRWLKQFVQGQQQEQFGCQRRRTSYPIASN